MKTTQLLVSELDALQQGRCWIGYNAIEMLEGIDHKAAQFRAYAGGNSIWQITNHVAFWRGIVAKKLLQEKITDEKTGMDEPAEATPEVWRQTLNRFQESYESLRKAIAEFPEEKLEEIASGKSSYRNEIVGLLEHDAFHLGQIMLLKRAQGLGG